MAKNQKNQGFAAIRDVVSSSRFRESRFKGEIVEIVNECFIREIQIKENDFITFSILLGLCDKVKILSPQKYKEKVLAHISEIKKNFT